MTEVARSEEALSAVGSTAEEVRMAAAAVVPLTELEQQGARWAEGRKGVCKEVVLRALGPVAAGHAAARLAGGAWAAMKAMAAAWVACSLVR